MQNDRDVIGEWPQQGLVDPRGRVFEEKKAEKAQEIESRPIQLTHGKIGLLSNKKPNADAMLQEVQKGLAAANPGLTFVYGCKEPLAERAPEIVIESLLGCDAVVLASAECGGCSSWVCRDYITLEERGVPCMLIATNRFEKLSRLVLTAGGIKSPRLAIAPHPVSGIPAEQAQAKIRAMMGHFTAEILGSKAEAEVKVENV